MRLIDADKMAVEESEAYISAQCQIKDELARSVNAVVHTKIQRLIADTPTVDVAPVRHGWWIDKGEYAVCTECDGRSGTQYDGVEPIPLMTQFCPNCGAKMDGGADNGA